MTEVFTVDNIGGSQATGILYSITTTGGGFFNRIAGTCGATLTPTEPPCTIIVEYAPGVGTEGTVHDETYSLDYNNGAAADIITRGLRGNSVAPANLVLISGAPNFGNRPTGSSIDEVYVIENQGDVDANLIAEIAPILGAGFNYTLSLIHI